MKKIIFSLLVLLAGIEVAHAQAPSWSVDPGSYNYSMQVTCKLNKTCVDLANSNNMVGAFVNGQCRGVIQSNTVADGDYLALLVIHSNSVSGEKVSFQVYNSATNATYNALDSVTFSNGAQIGTLQAPFVVTDNYAPTDISLSNRVVLETAAVGDFIATISVVDDNVPLSVTVSLPSVLDNANYAVSGFSLNLNATLDYETDQEDSIEILVTDPYGCSYSERFKIFINDQNDAPTDIQFVQVEVNDLDSIGTYIGLFTTTDPDPLDAFTYTLVSGTGDENNSAFFIRNDSLFANATVVHDSTPVLYFRVRSTDVGGLFVEDTFHVDVIDSNDPTDILIPTLQILEDNPVDFFVSVVQTVDADLVDTFVYQLVSGSGDSDNDQFYIVNDSLFIKAKTIYDVKQFYSFRIKTTDKLGRSFEKEFQLEVLDDPGKKLGVQSANYISPNGDGKNDYWEVVNVDIYVEFELEIYDAFGFVVYHVDNNYNNEWDGKLNGKALPSGNYYFVFKNDKITYKGNVTLVN